MCSERKHKGMRVVGYSTLYGMECLLNLPGHRLVSVPLHSCWNF